MITMAKEQADGSVDPQRREDVDHERIARRSVAIVWAKTNGDPSDKSIRGFIVPTDTQGLQGEGPEGQALAARVGHERARVPGRASPGGRDPSEVAVGSRARSCASRRRATASRGARSAPRWRASRRRSRIRKSRVMFDKADRRLPDPAGAARRHAHRDREGAARLAAPRPAEGRGHVDAAAGVAREAEQRAASRPTSRARRAGSLAPMAFSPSTRRCGTWRISRASTRTKERTTSTR